MPFDPRDFFELSKTMTKQLGVHEGVCRTAIGRAYYAAHLSARAKVPAGSWVGLPKKSDEHWFVRHIMKKNHHPDIADKLEALHQIRKTADYDMSACVGMTDVNDATLLTENLLTMIAEL